MHIILDNGHGLNTPGKRSPDGTLIEAIYTRQLVNDLALELENMVTQSTSSYPNRKIFP